MIHKIRIDSDSVYHYVSVNTSNGKIYFFPDEVSCIESNSMGPDVVINMKSGKTIYAKDKLETLLEEIYGVDINPIIDPFIPELVPA